MYAIKLLNVVGNPPAAGILTRERGRDGKYPEFVRTATLTRGRGIANTRNLFAPHMEPLFNPIFLLTASIKFYFIWD